MAVTDDPRTHQPPAHRGPPVPVRATDPAPGTLTAAQVEARERFRVFAAEHVARYAGDWDRGGALPASAVEAMADAGYLGALVPPDHGGGGWDAVTFGLLNEAVGAACSSLRSVLTVHSMVTHAVARWGSPALRARWLGRLARGEAVGAFALSEPGAGSDAAAIATTAAPVDGGYVLNGTKTWITYGQAADVYLVFARSEDRPAAFLVERRTPGLIVHPLDDLLGTRASRLATLELVGCRVPADSLVGRVGFGLAAVAATALGVGRYSVAWGCVGLAQACLDLATDHAVTREQFGRPLAEHQLVARLLTDMATTTTAARLLCLRAGALQDAGRPDAVAAVWMAKYAASTGAARAAADAVQILGAQGCVPGHPAQRMFRDSKVMELIEGSTQIQQTMIAQLIRS